MTISPVCFSSDYSNLIPPRDLSSYTTRAFFTEIVPNYERHCDEVLSLLEIPLSLKPCFLFYDPFDISHVSYLNRYHAQTPWLKSFAAYLEKRSEKNKALSVAQFHEKLTQAILNESLPSHCSVYDLLTVKGGLFNGLDFINPFYAESSFDPQHILERIGLRHITDLLQLLMNCQEPYLTIEEFVLRYTQRVSVYLHADLELIKRALQEFSSDSSLLDMLDIKCCDLLPIQIPELDLQDISTEDLEDLHLFNARECYDLVQDYSQRSLILGTKLSMYDFMQSHISKDLLVSIRSLRALYKMDLKEVLESYAAGKIDLSSLLASFENQYSKKPQKVRDFVKASPIDDAVFTALLRRLPGVFEDFPSDRINLFHSLSSEDQICIISKEPKYFLFLDRYSIFQLFPTSSGLPSSLIIPCLISLLETPHLWPQLSIYFATDLVELLKSSRLFQRIFAQLSQDQAQKFQKRILSFFENNHFPPSLRQLFSLEHKLWKMLIDVPHHKFGKEVFDLGLHDEGKEPDYYENMKAALIYLAVNYTNDAPQLISFEDYLIANKIAKNAQNLDTTNDWRNLKSRGFLTQLYVRLNPQIYYSPSNPESFQKLSHQFFKDAIRSYTRPSFTEMRKFWIKTGSIPGKMSIVFRKSNPQALETRVRGVFEEYSKLISAFSSLSERELLFLLLRFTQKLERIHYFPDGNTRTHYLLLLVHLAMYRFPLTCLDPNVFYLAPHENLLDLYASGVSTFAEEQRSL